MKYLVFADPHISEKVGLAGANTRIQGDDDRRKRTLVDAKRDFEWMANIAREHDVDHILCAGDLYDRPTPTPNEECVAIAGLRKLSDAVRSTCPETGDIRQGTVVVTLGNHTQSHGDDSHALEPIRSAQIPGVEVVDTPRTMCFGGDTIHCLPYPPLGYISGASTDIEGVDWTRERKNSKVSENLSKILDAWIERARSSDAPHLLLSHVTFAGSKYSEGRAVPATDVAAPTSGLEHFTGVLAGHLHLAQRIGGLDYAQYIGPPNRWSFQDEDHFAGCMVVETKGGSYPVSVAGKTAEYSCESNGPPEVEIERIENPHAREFVTYWPGDIEDIPSEIAGDCIGRVKGQVQDLDRMREIEDAIESARSEFLAFRNDVTLQRDRSELTDIERGTGLRDIFDRFCEDRPEDIPEDKREAVFREVEEITERVRD
ncbi:MAG: exonuclease SbcCD subunit D [Bradymonadaceae bacterium]